MPTASPSSQETQSDHDLPDDLFQLWRIPLKNESDPSKAIPALRERIKELNCLYGISQLAERHSDSIDDLLQDLVNFLPYSWQYPEITCARIVFKDKIFKSKGEFISNFSLKKFCFHWFPVKVYYKFSLVIKKSISYIAGMNRNFFHIRVGTTLQFRNLVKDFQYDSI